MDEINKLMKELEITSEEAQLVQKAEVLYRKLESKLEN